MRTRLVCAIAALLAAYAAPALAQDVVPPRNLVKAPKAEYSPYVDDYFPNRVFFGDTHLHSSWSTDAGMGGATLGPDEAYRVSRGEEVTSHLGWRVKLIRPLDFLVLADHAENLGLADFIRRSDPILLANETDAALDDLRRQVFRSNNPGGCTYLYPGSCVYLADLVHSGKLRLTIGQ